MCVQFAVRDMPLPVELAAEAHRLSSVTADAPEDMNQNPMRRVVDLLDVGFGEALPSVFDCCGFASFPCDFFTDELDPTRKVLHVALLLSVSLKSEL